MLVKLNCVRLTPKIIEWNKNNVKLSKRTHRLASKKASSLPTRINAKKNTSLVTMMRGEGRVL